MSVISHHFSVKSSAASSAYATVRLNQLLGFSLNCYERNTIEGVRNA